MSNTQRWKNNEKQSAEIAKKYLIPAERISRAGNYSVSDYDVKLLEHPEYKLDAKYSQRGFLTTRMLETVREKYCKTAKDIPVLLTKGYREVSQKVTIDAEFFFALLSFWLGYASKDQIKKIMYKGKD